MRRRYPLSSQPRSAVIADLRTQILSTAAERGLIRSPVLPNSPAAKMAIVSGHSSFLFSTTGTAPEWMSASFLSSRQIVPPAITE
jgi:hypothetical protein